MLRRRSWLLLLAILLLLTGCAQPPAAPTAPPKPSDPEKVIRERSALVIRALKAADRTQLAALVHPQKGVRFSPYAFVRTGKDGDLVFTPGQLRELDPAKVYHWGIADGSGAPIDLTFDQYSERFAKKDYLSAPQVGYNKIIRQGNSQVNIKEAYPDGIFIEYHIPGTGEHADFTWSSLRLVFEQSQGQWYLVGVINDQWTI